MNSGTNLPPGDKNLCTMSLILSILLTCLILLR